MCFIEVFWAMCRSEKNCCFCIKVRNGLKGLYLADIFETCINVALVVLYFRIRDQITLVPWVFILFGNLIPIAIRLLGLMLRACGMLRLWTREAYFCTRLWALLFMFVILVIQVAATYYVIQNEVASLKDLPLVGKYLETEQTLNNITG